MATASDLDGRRGPRISGRYPGTAGAGRPASSGVDGEKAWRTSATSRQRDARMCALPALLGILLLYPRLLFLLIASLFK